MKRLVVLVAVTVALVVLAADGSLPACCKTDADCGANTYKCCINHACSVCPSCNRSVPCCTSADCASSSPCTTCYVTEPNGGGYCVQPGFRPVSGSFG